MSINLNVNGNTAPLEAAVQAAVNRIRKTPIKVTVDDKGATQPLGNMKRGADEFSKSMEAANARIIAFGASMAIINGISDAFKAMVTNVVQVEKALADINVVMGLSLANLDKFSDSLFKVAKETAASFDVAAAAATEYARQGLAVEETLKRTKDALILTRLTGMDSANAVKALTAAMNTYGDEIKDTTQLVSKFAAVDVKFAVSAEDFADAISRTGQAAKSAGVDIDELVGLITAAQQKTARGGKVIGNSFKTIFTRIGRTDTLNQLENLGIAVRDVEGNTMGAKRILTDLANTFDSLTESQKAQIAQTVGGVFQINVLKAVLSDAAKQNGILANATQISAGATDEAIQKNEQLRSTMSAMASETGLALKEVSAKIGELAIAPGMEKILNIVKGFAEGASDMLGDGESSGNKFATGFLKGLGNIITGPGLVVIVAVFGKLFLKAAQYARESLSSLIGVTSEAQKQKAIQTSLVTLFGQNAALSKEMLRTDISRTEKERIILGLLKAQVVEANALNTIARSSAANLYQKGYGSNLAPRGKPRRTSAQGYIPNYVDAERQQAAQGGYAAGSIRSMNMPGEGSVIYNSAEKVKNFKGMSQPAIMPPKSSKAGENYQQAFDSIHGFDPYAAGGYIPNFAKKTASKTSDIPRNLNSKKLGDLNKDSSLILLTADSSADSESRFFVGKDPKGGTKILNTADLASKRTTGYYQVDVPYYSLDKNDKSRKSKIDLPSIQKAITAAASGKALDIAKQIVGGEKNLKPFNREQIKETFNKGAFKGAAGSAFESAIAAALDSYLFQDYKARTDTSAIDLPYDPKVFQYFGAPPGAGKMGAEVKADLANNLQQGAANKFYQVLAGGRAAWQYKDKNFKDQMRGSAEDAGLERRGGAYFKKGRAYGHIPNFAAARLALTGGLVGKNKFGNIDRRQMTRLVRSNPYFNGLMNEHLTWDSFPKKDKRKLSRWLLKQGVSNRALQAYGLASMHSKSIGEGISSLAMAKGYIPNFADPLSDAIGREKEAGVPVSKIRIGSHPALMGKSNPVGLGVTNTDDEPNGLRDVFGAANGYVPNYAPTPLTYSDIGSGRSGGSSAAQAQMEKSAKQYNKSLQRLIKLFERKKLSHEQLIKGSNNLNQKYRVNASASSKVSKELNSMQGSIGKAKAGLERASLSYQRSSVGRLSAGAGRMFSGNAGMMMMMGAPMAAGFLQSDGPGQAGMGGAAYSAGGALTGAASGAMMASMVAPMFGPAAPLVIAMGGLVGGFKGFISAQEENTKALEKNRQELVQKQTQTASQSLSKVVQASELRTSLKQASLVGEGDKLGLGQDDSVINLIREVGKKSKGFNFDEKGQGKGNLQGINKGDFERFSSLMNWNAKTGDIESKSKFEDGDAETMEKWYNKQTREYTQRESEDFKVYKKVSKKIMDLPDNQEAPMPQDLRSFLKSRDGDAEAGMNASIDYILKNEAGNEFEFGDQKFDRENYRKLMRGERSVNSKGNNVDALDLETRGNALTGQAEGILDKENKANGEKLKGIIVQIDNQRMQITAQRAIAMKQLEIKDHYSEISEDLKFEVMLMGSLMTDKQKAENKYLQAINKSAEAYEKSAASADGQLRTGLLNQIKGSADVQGLLKESLGLEKGAQFQDISDKVGSLTGGQMVEKLKEIAADSDTEDTMRKAINDLLTVEIDKRQNILDIAEKTKTNSTDQATREQKINNILAGRSQIIKDLERGNRMSSEDLRSSQKIRGFTEQVAAAKRLNAVGPGYQTKRERENFTMSEKRFGLESKITTLEENKAKSIGELNIEKEKTNQVIDQDKLKNLRQNKKDAEDYSEPLLISDQDLETLNKLEELEVERIKKLEEIEQKIKNINSETDSEIDKAKILLEKEKERLEIKRKHETGPGAFGRGLAGGMKSMAEQVETMDYELGTRLPQTFANGLSGAFIEAINGAKDLDDALREAGLNFLKMIQEAMMQKMVMQMMGGLGFSQGGNVRNYSKGGNVPARVSNGEYLMSREAVNKYGGSFMHGLNARGKAPGFSSGGRTIQPGSQLSVNPGSFDSGRKYQRRQMSGFFYSGQGNTMGMREDQETVRGIIAEREAKRREEEAKARAKKQEKRAMWGMLASTVAMGAISHMMSGGIDTRTAGAKADGYTADTPSGVRSATKDGYQYSLLPGASSEGFDNVSKTRSWNPFSWGGSGASMNERQFQFNDFQTSPNYGVPLDPFGYNDPRLAYFGGKISNYANGGPISGKPGIDQIPAMLSEGEYVVKASSARQIGKPMLDRINAGKFYNGGAVSEMEEASDSGISGGKTNNINISVNIEKGSVKSENSESKGDDEKEKSEGSSLAEKIKEQILSVIIEEQRPGGVLED
jgi:TP901 family phage tail tape measure protein